DFQKKAVAADWLAAMAGLAVALGLTLGGGLNWCWAAAASLWGAGPAGQCALAAGVMLALAAADLPLAWARHDRLRRDYRALEETRASWILRFAADSLAGWLASLPLIVAFVCAFSALGDGWWLPGAALTTLWCWRRCGALAPWAGPASDIPEGPARRSIAAALAGLGFERVRLCSAGRPRRRAPHPARLSWTPAGWRFTVARECLSRLTPGELAALAACAAGRKARWHDGLRMAACAAAAFLAWRAAAALLSLPAFYEGVGLMPALFFEGGQPAGGGVALTLMALLAPVALLPAAMALNAFLRSLDYAEDACGVRCAGLAAVEGALAKLHCGFADSVPLSPLYSLARHPRPQGLQRIAAARRAAARHQREEAARREEGLRADALLFTAAAKAAEGERSRAEYDLVRAALRDQRRREAQERAERRAWREACAARPRPPAVL
ncbi:MAG: hypothetical protein HUK26_04285, partial [Duodenibacillus sp.]|nr:hypothetical protein [Duodenibacillus sp.]